MHCTVLKDVLGCVCHNDGFLNVLTLFQQVASQRACDKLGDKKNKNNKVTLQYWSQWHFTNASTKLKLIYMENN